MKNWILFFAVLLSISCSTVFARHSEWPMRARCRNSVSKNVYGQPQEVTLARQRLERLRLEMRRRMSVLGAELDAYIVPSYDEHQSETPGDRDRRLLFLSGFSGSDGVAVVTLDSAALWTDERYKLQADRELSCDWDLVHQETPSVPRWLGTQLQPNARVGADPKLVPHHMWQQWEEVLSVMGIALVQAPNNLVDIVWDKEVRPPASKVQTYVHSKIYAGKFWQAKVEDLRRELKIHDADAMVVTALDEIHWLLNIRGNDLPYTPVTKSYLVVTYDQLHLYIDKSKLSVSATRHLHVEGCYNANCTKIHPYDNIWNDLRTLSQAWRYVLLPATYSFAPGVSEAIFTSISEEKRLYKPSPIINMKAKKNPTEIEGMRKAHIRDAAAMCEVLAYIEERMQLNDQLSEMTIAKEVDLTRKSQEHNKGLSFATIAGYGSNGALPHYQPTVETNKTVLKDLPFVLDSGGQYDDGTTDVTRTLHYGKPSREMVKAYTLVLMASIELASAIFPSSVRMSDVDILGRTVLWQHHKHFMYSTGHGIGSFLQAHEAPIQIAYGGDNKQKNVFKPGYFFSNEPGYYKEGKFGVRLENILEVVEAFGDLPDDDGLIYYKFEDVTLVPYEPKMIDVNMLTLYQRRWLNDYNKRIREKVGAELKRRTKMTAFHWMMNKTVLVPEYGLVSYATSLNFYATLPVLTISCLLIITHYAAL